MTALFYLSIAAAASLLSIARILITNPSALSTLVWAEDGLFPLCVTQHGYVSCLVDPFAGYFLFLSRTLAVPVSWAPIDTWPLATNVVAALSIGALAALIAWIAVRSGWSGSFAAATAMVPVVIPIAGFEAVNAAGSAYMLLLIAASMMVSLPAGRKVPVWVLPTLLLVTSLTIPSSALLLVPLTITMLTHPREWTRYAVSALALIAGIGVQLVTTLTTDNPRPIAISSASLEGWVQGLPIALRTLWPGGVVLGPTGVLEGWAVPSPAVSWLLLTTLILVAVILIIAGLRSHDRRLSGLGLLIGSGLALGAGPAIAGFANNRYYVIPLAVLVMASVLALGLLIHRYDVAIALGVVAVMVVIWAPGFAAGSYRSNASPEWPAMLMEARNQCASGAIDVALTFSPNWPFADAVFPGVTSQRVPCDWLLTTE